MKRIFLLFLLVNFNICFATSTIISDQRQCESEVFKQVKFYDQQINSESETKARVINNFSELKAGEMIFHYAVRVGRDIGEASRENSTYLVAASHLENESVLRCVVKSLELVRNRQDEILFDVSKAIFKNFEMEFIPHQTALSINIPYWPVKELRQAIASELEVNLKFFQGWNHEGEAHITVITPPEYEKIKDYISMKELNSLAIALKLQGSNFSIEGIGKGSKNFGREHMETYFLIVSSQDVFNYRQSVKELLNDRGAPDDLFHANNHALHITIGYTHRDLHLDDGVIKDKNHTYDYRMILKIK